MTEQVSINVSQPLRIFMPHVLGTSNLLDHHRDPFDRLLIVQSPQLQGPVLTKQAEFSLYTGDTIW